MAMLGAFNRVSHLFRQLCTMFHPRIYIRDDLAESLALEGDISISVMKLYKAAGRSSGLSTRLKGLLCKNSQWMKAWIILSHVGFGMYKIKDIYWKK